MKLLDLREKATIDHTSGVINILDKYKKETDKFGGEVRVSIVRGQQLSVAVGDFKDDHYNQIKASATTGGKWNVKEARGDMIEKLVRRKSISDEEMTKAVEAVFAVAKKYYK